MLRTLLAVTAGYLVMAVLIFVLFSIVYLVLGTPDSFNPSKLWNLTSFVLGFFAAVAGGWVCATLAKDWKASIALALLVLGLGILIVGYATLLPGNALSPEREGSASTRSAMLSGDQPLWVTVLNPIIGAGGIILGGQLKRRAKPKPR